MTESQTKRTFSASMRDTNSPFLPDGKQVGERPIRVGFILQEHFSMMAFTAAVDAIVTANLVNTTPLFSFSTYGIDQSTVRSDLGIDISVNDTLPHIALEGDNGLDILIVCGGFRCDINQSPALNSALKSAARYKLTLGGLWNGAIALAHAQLLDRKHCALHPDNHAYMQEHFPDTILSDQTWIADNQRFTCAGPSSALEMMLSLIEGLYGKDTIRAIREILSCDKNNDSDNNQITQTRDNPNLPDLLRELLQLMNSNIEEPLSIDELAGCVNASRRRVERLFQTHLETTPSRYYLELRITQARRLLLQSNESIANIAVSCGFLSSTHFSHCFKDFFGTSPSQARQKHRNQES